MWRIQTHDRYGGTWLSDYVPNRLGGFLHQPSRQKPTMSLIGMDGNIFAVMGKASSLLKEAGMGDLVSHMVQRVTTCGVGVAAAALEDEALLTLHVPQVLCVDLLTAG